MAHRQIEKTVPQRLLCAVIDQGAIGARKRGIDQAWGA
jgi:hypothetical protein